jgi:hypothetical protein
MERTMKEKKKGAKKILPPWEKVPFAGVCERIKGIEGLENLDDEAVAALAAAVCITCRVPKDLAKLLTKAKTALGNLELWYAEHRENKEFRADLKGIISKCNSLHFTSFTILTVPASMPTPRHLHYVDEKNLALDGRIDFTPSKSSTEERTILIPHPRRTRTKTGLEPFLVLAVGVLRPWLDTNSTWHGLGYVTERHDELAMNQAFAMSGLLLDEFFWDDYRFDGRCQRDPDNIRIQFNRGVRNGSAVIAQPTKMLLDQVRENGGVVDHAWLPIWPSTSS